MSIQPIQTLLSNLRTFHDDEEGAGATEYIILLILIACVVIAIVKVFGETISEKFDDADEVVDKEVTF